MSGLAGFFPSKIIELLLLGTLLSFQAGAEMAISCGIAVRSTFVKKIISVMVNEQRLHDLIVAGPAPR